MCVDISRNGRGPGAPNQPKNSEKLGFGNQLKNSQKLAKKISEEQKKQNKKPKIFIQINLGEETQKSGINKENLMEFYNFTLIYKITTKFQLY